MIVAVLIGLILAVIVYLVLAAIGLGHLLAALAALLVFVLAIGGSFYQGRGGPVA